MLLGLAAMTLLYLWLLAHRYQVGRLEEELDEAELLGALEDRRAEAGPAGSGEGEQPGAAEPAPGGPAAGAPVLR